MRRCQRSVREETPTPRDDPGLSPLVLASPARPAGTRRWPTFFIPVAGALRYAKVSGRDYGRARLLKWCTDAQGYPAAQNLKALGGDGRKITLHAFVLGRKEGFVIDHMDGNKHNCTRGNLRHVSPAVNATNRCATNKSRSGVRGIHAFGKQWQVQFKLDHTPIFLGHYADLKRATRIVAVSLGLIYGRGVRLIDGTPFDESQIERIVAEADALPPADLWMVIARTAHLGDDLSAQLRTRLVTQLLEAAAKTGP